MKVRLAVSLFAILVLLSVTGRIAGCTAFASPIDVPFGSPIADGDLDGVLGNEWSDAASFSTRIGSYTATVYMKHDSEYLYIAVTKQGRIAGGSLTLWMVFDANGDGSMYTAGDDSLMLPETGGTVSRDIDYAYTKTREAPRKDTSVGGTRDKAGAGGLSGDNYVFETKIKMSSGDAAGNDIALSPCSTIWWWVGFANNQIDVESGGISIHIGLPPPLACRLQTDKPVYYVGENVVISYENTGNTLFGCTTFPITITTNGQPVFDPDIPAPMFLYTGVKPGESWQHVWDQTDLNGQQVSPGTYTVTDSTCDCSATVTFRIVSPPPPSCQLQTDKPVYYVGESVQITYTNTGSTSITCTSHPVTISRNGQIVYDPPIWLALNIKPGETWQQDWDQKDWPTGSQVPPGTYTVTDSTCDCSATVTFRIVSPPPPSCRLQTDKPVYCVGESVQITYTNTGSTSIGCTSHPVTISRNGQIVYDPPILVVVQVKPGETWQQDWDQKDWSNGNQVPPGDYTVTDSTCTCPAATFFRIVECKEDEGADEEEIGPPTCLEPPLYEDGFSDPNSGWPLYRTAAGYSYGYNLEEQEYFISVDAPDTAVWSVNESVGPFTDVCLSADAVQLSGSAESAYGVVFGYQDDDNFFVFTVSESGVYSLTERIDGTDALIVPPTPSTSIHTGPGANHLEVILRGTDVYLFVNLQPLTTVGLPNLEAGYAGLYAASSAGGNLRTHFDDFSIRQAEGGETVSQTQDTPSTQGQPECSVTLQPGESIQAAINAAEEGAVICLAEGIWEEDIRIRKSLALRGIEGKTTISGVAGYPPVVSVATPDDTTAVVVEIENLTITDFKADPYVGIMVEGSAQVEITNCTISDSSNGVWLLDSARAEIEATTISNNIYRGISCKDSTQVTITNASVTGNAYSGIELSGEAQATIENTVVRDNRQNGIYCGNSARAEVIDSTVCDNDWRGVFAVDTTWVTITGSMIFGNSSDGVELMESAQATIEGNTITSNGGYGVLLHAACYGTGEVSPEQISGHANVIPGSGDADGNAKGAVCPEDLSFLMASESTTSVQPGESIQTAQSGVATPALSGTAGNFGFELVKEIPVDGNVGRHKELYVDDDYLYAGTYNGSLYIFEKDGFTLHKMIRFNAVGRNVNAVVGDDSSIFVCGVVPIEEPTIETGEFRDEIRVYDKPDFTLRGTIGWDYGDGRLADEEILSAPVVVCSISAMCVDDDYLYVGSESSCVDEEYVYGVFINPEWLRVYDKDSLELVNKVCCDPAVQHCEGLYVFDKQDLSLVKLIEVPAGAMVNVDDRFIYVGDAEAYVTIFDKRTFDKVKVLTEAHDIIATGESYPDRSVGIQHNYVNAIAYDSDFIYVGTEFYKIRIYDKETWRQIEVIQNAWSAEVRALERDERYLYAGSSFADASWCAPSSIPADTSPMIRVFRIVLPAS